MPCPSPSTGRRRSRLAGLLRSSLREHLLTSDSIGMRASCRREWRYMKLARSHIERIPAVLRQPDNVMGFVEATHMLTWALALVLLAFSYAFSLVKWRRRSRGLPLPRGPKSWPFIGNLAHMGKPEPWKAHHELSQQYGECYRTCCWRAVPC